MSNEKDTKTQALVELLTELGYEEKDPDTRDTVMEREDADNGVMIVSFYPFNDQMCLRRHNKDISFAWKLDIRDISTAPYDVLAATIEAAHAHFLGGAE